jgi:hypothetical protein
MFGSRWFGYFNRKQGREEAGGKTEEKSYPFCPHAQEMYRGALGARLLHARNTSYATG